MKKTHPTSLFKSSRALPASEEGDGVKKTHSTSLSKSSRASLALEEGDGVKKTHPTSLFKSSRTLPASEEGDGVKKTHPTSLSKSSRASLALEEGDGVKKTHPTSLSKSSRASLALEEGDGVKKTHPTSLSKSSRASLASEEEDSIFLSKPPRATLVAEKGHASSLVVISSSPPKNDPNIWLPHLDLYLRDKAILESSGWLNDAIIYRSQKLLEAQTKGNICGWQSPQFSKREGMFAVVPQSSPFVQILHVGNCHWLTTSNVNVHGGASYNDVVSIYDSGKPIRVSNEVTKSVCSFFKCMNDIIRFDIMNVSPQTNSQDCGVYAIAYATELAHGADPVTCNWDVDQMRGHLLHCLESGVLTRFPQLPNQRRVRFGTRVRKSFTFVLYCTCRTVNDEEKSMIECVRCQKWYHKKCMSLDEKKSYGGIEWKCFNCNIHQ